MTRHQAWFARQRSISTAVAILFACSHCSDTRPTGVHARISHAGASSSHHALAKDAALDSGTAAMGSDCSLDSASPEVDAASDVGADCTPLDADIGYTSSGPPELSSCLRQTGSFIGPNKFGYTADWSPTSDYLLAGTMGLLRLLSVDTRAETVVEVATFKQPPVQVYAEWSPDGRYALSAGADVRLIQVVGDPPAIVEIARYAGHTDSVVAVAWSPDGQLALTGSKDKTVRLLAVDGDRGLLEERASYHGHVGEVFAVAWSPDGRNALSMGKDRTMRLLSIDAAAGTLSEVTSVTDVDWETAVAWASGDRPVLAGDWGLLNQVEMWSVDASHSTLVSKGVLTNFDRVGAQVLEWSRAGNLLAAAGHDDNVLQLFSYANRRFTGIGSLTNWKHGVHAASWSRDGNFIAIAAAYTEHVMLLDVRDCFSQSMRQ